MKRAKIICILILAIFLFGCSKKSENIDTQIKEENEQINEEHIGTILRSNDPRLCLGYDKETINESLSHEYVQNIAKVYSGEEILFKDLCLIYSMKNKSNVNDELILLCSNASDRIYKFMEEGSYDVAGWEFCLRTAFNVYDSYRTPPDKGEIKKISTCDYLRKFRDECLWLVAKNGDISACNEMNSTRNKEICMEEFS